MKIKLLHRLVIVVWLLMQLPAVFAAIKPNSLFSDGMVLQQGKQLPVWGTASEGQEVTVNFNGQTIVAKTTDGKWMAKLAPLQYSSMGAVMTISNGNEKIIINDLQESKVDTVFRNLEVELKQIKRHLILDEASR